MEFRDLKPDEIDVRVQRVTAKGVSLLLYKDARVDMNILDETVGAENWQNRFYEHKGILFCSLGINTNYKSPERGDRWIWKDDAGTESNMEAEKGNASDARKRSGFAWGIGRELYTVPFIWVPENACRIAEERGSLKCKDTFSVQDMVIENKRIIFLSIRNDNSKQIVFQTNSNHMPLRNHKCAECGSIITDSRKQSGAVWSADEIAKYTKLKFGEQLCAACGEKRAKGQ